MFSEKTPPSTGGRVGDGTRHLSRTHVPPHKRRLSRAYRSFVRANRCPSVGVAARGCDGRGCGDATDAKRRDAAGGGCGGPRHRQGACVELCGFGGGRCRVAKLCKFALVPGNT